ncbi:hypothetical protein RB195_005772 [Necator americanus]|uniref:ShKT domain-containing protein n=1 Tax=Necator americanus TaxID=51031 RepID=A0ABR1BPI9_NECAM
MLLYVLFATALLCSSAQLSFAKQCVDLIPKYCKDFLPEYKPEVWCQQKVKEAITPYGKEKLRNLKRRCSKTCKFC